MQTETEAFAENRLTQPYQLSLFPWMTLDQFEGILRILGLVNESRNMSLQFSLGVKLANTVHTNT